jgi:hypothetical protein
MAMICVHPCFPNHALSARIGPTGGAQTGMQRDRCFYGMKRNTDEHRWFRVPAVPSEHARRLVGTDYDTEISGGSGLAARPAYGCLAVNL